ncbi:MAG: family 78 glycoside hydrolase catalytic domain, partial [Verrucomicrobiales bacterium]|nr:family 78 glycoside hydrolase catalytic domain [Verrucomicrobiales bacterium]
MKRFIAIACLWAACLGAGAASLPPPGHLRCESLENPLGIETPRPRLSWKLGEHVPTEGVALARRGVRQAAYRVLVATSAERLARHEGDLWDSGIVRSDDSTQVAYEGKPLPSRQRVHWKVRWIDDAGAESAWSRTATWSMGWLRPEDWESRWITSGNESPDGLPMFRVAFRIEKPVRRAELAICGLGFQEVRVDGVPVDVVPGSIPADTYQLEPGWTQYRKTCLYRVLDLAGRLAPGDHVLGVLLGHGMYHVPGGRYVKFTGSFGPPKLVARLDVDFVDGSSTRITSGPDWKTAAGPITFSCIFGGEDYDARRERPGWDRPGYDDSEWRAAVPCEGPGGRLSTRSAPPIRVVARHEPRRVASPAPGVWVYDLGQNLSGWPRLTVRGPAGATVKMTTGELLDENGRVSQRSSGSPVWFAYTLAGGGTENWRPRFSYTGFRYVQVEGALPADAPKDESGSPRVLRLEAEFLGPDTSEDGRFECSNPDANRVHALILAAIRSNYKSVLTDCPHREKLGWLECSHLLAGCLMYNHDCRRFYAKIAGDMADSQLDDGLVPSIAP